jgi:hypothetical protein
MVPLFRQMHHTGSKKALSARDRGFKVVIVQKVDLWE